LNGVTGRDIENTHAARLVDRAIGELAGFVDQDADRSEPLVDEKAEIAQ
jgi:hypothetical protein